jgi:hypothetical protein
LHQWIPEASSAFKNRLNSQRIQKWKDKRWMGRYERDINDHGLIQRSNRRPDHKYLQRFDTRFQSFSHEVLRRSSAKPATWTNKYTFTCWPIMASLRSLLNVQAKWRPSVTTESALNKNSIEYCRLGAANAEDQVLPRTAVGRSCRRHRTPLLLRRRTEADA